MDKSTYSGSAVQLQVLVCTKGADGMQRVASRSYPRVDGVEYLVSWQIPDGDAPVPTELYRQDIRVVRVNSVGLSNNRNNALRCSSAPLLLIADDDVDYSAEGLKGVLEAFRTHPECDCLTFMFDGATKKYPDRACFFPVRTKGYFVTSFELALRSAPVKGKVEFDPRFGIGAEFSFGEEEIFLHECLRRGLTACFIPLVITSHKHSTTAVRMADSPELIVTKGAVFFRMKPYLWPLYMISHAFRVARRSGMRSGVRYCRLWLRGVRRYIKK